MKPRELGEQGNLDFGPETPNFTPGEKELIKRICVKIKEGQRLIGEEPRLYNRLRDSIFAKQREKTKGGSVHFSEQERAILSAELENKDSPMVRFK